MTKNEIISKKKYQDNEGYTEQKIIFNNNMFEQIKGKELDLSINKILHIPKLKNLFKIYQDEYYVISQKEPIEKSVISAVRGNLIYQKFKFTINYSVAIQDTNINDAGRCQE